MKSLAMILFFEINNEYDRESPILPDGSTLKWHIVEKNYTINPEITKEFKLLFFDIALEWSKMYSDKSKGKFCSSWFGNEINDFNNEFQNLNFK